MAEKIVVTKNIYADLDFENPDEWMAKTQLAVHILRIIKELGLARRETAHRLGVSELRVEDLEEARLDAFTYEELFDWLNAFEQRVEILIRPTTNKSDKVAVTVNTGASTLPDHS